MKLRRYRSTSSKVDYCRLSFENDKHLLLFLSTCVQRGSGGIWWYAALAQFDRLLSVLAD